MCTDANKEARKQLHYDSQPFNIEAGKGQKNLNFNDKSIITFLY